MSKADELADIRRSVKRHRKLGHQAATVAPELWDYRPKRLAKRWKRTGFTADEVDGWLSVRCFSPWTAAELNAASITPAMAGQRTRLGEGPADTIAFKCSARQLSVADALAGLGIPVLALDEREEEQLLQRNERLDDAVSRAMVALQDVHDAAAEGAVSPAEAGDAVFSVLTAIRQLASTLAGLSRETFRPIAHPAVRQRLESEESPGAQALSFADALDALSADLLAVHAQHYQALAGGAMATSEFGLRVVRRDGQQAHAAPGGSGR